MKRLQSITLLSHLIIIFVIVLAAATCQPVESKTAKDKQEIGYFMITISGIDSGNSLIFEAEFTSEGQPIHKKSWGPQRQSDSFEFAPGCWTVEIEAKDNGVLIAKGGMTNIIINKNETKQAVISLIPISHNTDPDDTEDPPKEDPPKEEYPVLQLFANNASGSAYELIQVSGFDYESPDQTNGGHEGQSHILQQYDSVLGKNVFAFIAHHDRDRNATGDWTRQRVEIKIDHRNNAGNPGRAFCGLSGENEGRSFIYRWKFKLPEDFAVSTEFTHIHQIKNEGGDAAQPVAALTARVSNGTPRMQLVYYAPLSSSPVYWVNSANSLSAYLGHWVQCEEKIIFSSDPSAASYSLKITRIADNHVLMNYAVSGGIYTWRTGNTHGRPKFGSYRRIFSGSNPGNFIEPDASALVPNLKDEIILYADFEAVRIK